MVLFIMLWAAIFTVVGIIIGTQNGNTMVNVSLLNWTFHNVSLTLVLIETFAIGIIFTIIVALIDEIRLKNRLWRSQREIKSLKEELSALRNLPIEEVSEAESIKEEEKEQEEKHKENDKEIK